MPQFSKVENAISKIPFPIELGHKRILCGIKDRCEAAAIIPRAVQGSQHHWSMDTFLLTYWVMLLKLRVEVEIYLSEGFGMSNYLAVENLKN